LNSIDFDDIKWYQCSNGKVRSPTLGLDRGMLSLLMAADRNDDQLTMTDIGCVTRKASIETEIGIMESMLGKTNEADSNAFEEFIFTKH
jgi:hypothetical protein